MGMLLAGVLILLLFVSFASIFVGLIFPHLYKPLFRKDLGRGKTSLIFLGICIAIFVVIVVFGDKLTAGYKSSAPSENKVVVNNSPTFQPIRTTPTPTTKPILATKPKPKNSPTPKPTPTPIPDPCSGVMGTSYYSDCKQGNTLQLNATVETNAFYLFVTNNDNLDWNQCVYSIGTMDDFNNMYYISADPYYLIKPHQTMEVPWSEIVKPDGTRFNYYEKEPNNLLIRCTIASQSAEWGN